VEADAEPLDAIDCEYIEEYLFRCLWRIPGLTAEQREGRLIIGAEDRSGFVPEQVGEVLQAALRNHLPKIKEIRVLVLTGAGALGNYPAEAAAEHQRRQDERRLLTEENAEHFYGCLGCSPFAPDHVCVLTADRVPQCGRSFGQIKTGALYGYDDMSDIHHSKMHRDINSYQVVEKGKCLDPVKGEWEGVNARARELTRGRTTRILLHTLAEAPTTGCGCFQYILFQTALPRPGIGIMQRGWTGAAPDGRRWSDLHHALAGKQAPGISGCGAGYFHSPKFLQADGGWQKVVWATPRVAEKARDIFPPGIALAEQP
jgi:acetyl-CoA decarbonylase/synthase complex subunit beta